MSDEEIRDLLDLGVSQVTEPHSRDYQSAEQLWSAGRRQRNRGRAWLGGLGAAAAAAGILGVVWAQGFAGGDASPPPPADTTPRPTVEVDNARGEPFFARFDRAETEPAEELTGTSRPATLEDLQGIWIGPKGEEFTFDRDRLHAVSSACHSNAGAIELTPEGRMRPIGAWDASVANGNCPEEETMTPWGPALHQQPLMSLDGETLIISGLDGTTAEARVQVALTLGQVDETGFNWADVPSATGVTPITLGNDFALSLSGDDDGTLGSINLVMLEERPGIAAAAQDSDIEVIAYPGTCPQVMESSLRSDGVLLAGPPRPMPACTDGSAAILPPSESSPAALALLRSGPTVGLDGDTMVITGTIPESLLDPTDPTEDETGAETPTQPDDIPLVVGTPRVIVMSEGEWAPTGELSPLTAEESIGRRWQLVELEGTSPRVHEPERDYGLTFDGSRLHVRACSVDITVLGTLRDGVFVASGPPIVVADPDPGSDCPVPVYTEEWVQLLTSEPRMSTDGEILVISGGDDDVQLEPVGMVLLPDGVTDPAGGPVAAVTPDDLAAGLTELSAEQAAGNVGVSDLRDPQPGHATTLSMADGIVTVDVGCAEPLQGPAWFSKVGPEDYLWQLTAALPDDPDCEGTAVPDAQLWRQMLAHGTFLHRFGDHVVLDAWADPSLAPVATP